MTWIRGTSSTSRAKQVLVLLCNRLLFLSVSVCVCGGGFKGAPLLSGGHYKEALLLSGELLGGPIT